MMAHSANTDNSDSVLGPHRPDLTIKQQNGKFNKKIYDLQMMDNPRSDPAWVSKGVNDLKHLGDKIKPHKIHKLFSKMLEYVIIPPTRYEAVIDHLRVNFPDEPLNASVGLCLHGTPCPLLEHHDLKTMEDGLSIMAIDKENQKIAGVALNGISNKGDTKKSLDEMKTISNLQYRRIFGLLNDVNLELDLFSKYNVGKIFEVRILSVDSSYRGKGIAKELFSQSEAVAKKNGFKVMKTDATSLFTQKVAESQGFWVEKSVNYHDYKDEHGQKIYDTRPPHLHYKVMAKLLE